MGVFALLLVATVGLFQVTPKGFIPVQDKQYLITLIQLPNAASLNRTDAIVRQVGEIGKKIPGVRDAGAVPWLVGGSGFTNSPNSAIVFFGLDDFDKRKSAELSGFAIAQKLNGALSSIKEAQIVTFPPPPVNGLGTLGGFKLQLEDRADLGYDELYNATQAVMNKARQAPELTGVFSNYEVNVPQVLADVNRVKAKEQWRAAQQRVRSAAGVPRVPVRERLQPLRPYLQGDRAGGLRLSRQARGHSAR